MTDRHWYAVSTQPLRESFAEAQLRRQGFEVFFPMQVKLVRHARRKEHRRVGYFPGYLFVALDLGLDPWRKVNGTLGVRSLVMAGDRPARAPLGLVENLRLACDESGLMTPPNDWKSGQRIRLLSGPFAEMLGVVDRLDGSERVRVLLDVIGGMRPVTIGSADLALAK